MVELIVGQTVHFYEHDDEERLVPRAAIVTEVYGDGEPFHRIGLCILSPDGARFRRLVKFAAEPTAGHWGFPRVEAPQKREPSTPRHASPAFGAPPPEAS